MVVAPSSIWENEKSSSNGSRSQKVKNKLENFTERAF